MRLLLTHERWRLTTACVLLVGTIPLTGVLAVEQKGVHTLVPAIACIVVFTMWWEQLTRWRNLLAFLLLVILFIPIKRYNLPGNLPFELEPYRVVVALLALAWTLALLVDPRVRLRRAGIDAPLIVLLLVVLFSDVVNTERVRPLSTEVLKSETFFISYVLVFYLVVSLVRTRSDLEFFVKLLAGGGGLLAFSAIVERRTGYNAFNHLQTIFPMLHFDGSSLRQRGGEVRVSASSQHPIAFSVFLVVLLPLVIYLARRNRKWLLVCGIYVIGIFTTGSRTGMVGLLVVGFVYVCLQPRTVRRAWPYAVPVLVAVHIAAPGALGTIRDSFDPTSLVAEQSDVVVQNDAYASGRLTDLGPSFSEWSQKPLLGEGFGTRLPTGPNANARVLDDAWLGILLETGFFGILAWIWLFVRSVRRLTRAAADAGDTDDGWLLTGFAAGLAGFAASMLFYDALSFIQNAFICFILLGLSAAYLNGRMNEGDGIRQAIKPLRRPATV